MAKFNVEIVKNCTREQLMLSYRQNTLEGFTIDGWKAYDYDALYLMDILIIASFHILIMNLLEGGLILMESNIFGVFVKKD